MVEIPQAKSTDAEDVVWGLQTADALWKRGERIDAVVWLRRAAQAAGDANDDDRALELARAAAELTEWMSRAEEGGVVTSVAPPPAAESVPVPVDVDVEEVDLAHGDSESVRSDASVLPAERVHAGMFDPWADGSSRSVAEAASPAPTSSSSGLPTTADPEDDEVITSVRPHKTSAPPKASSGSPPAPKPLASKPAAPNKPPPPKPPPPLPARARPPLPKPAPSPPASEPAPPPPAPEPAPPPAQAVEPLPAAVAAPEPVSPELAAATTLDLEAVEAFADLPDDARTAFAAAATIHTLSEGEEIGGFALAYVVSGDFDVAATMVDAPAVRLGTGAVLRARGTTDENVPMRLISAVTNGVVATWSDASVEDAFRSIPWVEDDLRAAADRVQTLVGITIGPLGERLDVSIREHIVERLTMRPLIAGEVVVEAGAPVPGLFLIGIGSLELVRDGKVSGVVGSGDFLFPTEVLGQDSAPATARAGSGGAVVLFGERSIAQELLVTCPPLLEVFAGM
jgi:hypothetical protein